MSGFRKAKAEQAALKVGIYGATGRGKTFTALLMAEGLAKLTKRRIAYVDTERGTDFYCKAVPERQIHPEAFDFDALYTRSLTETIASVKQLNPADYCCVVLDSITHLWEAAIAAYGGRQTSAGTIPMHAWGSIKKPYKELMSFLLSSPLHVIICGRQGNEWETDEDTGELKNVGTKMKAEGETPYEPHILIHLESTRDKKGDLSIWAHAEKDRTGVLAGKRIQLWPSQVSTFDLLVKPILPLLGGTQAQIESSEETSAKDAEALAAEESRREETSAASLKRWLARIDLCETADALKALGKEITPEAKKAMLPAHVTELRTKYVEAEKRLTGRTKGEAA